MRKLTAICFALLVTVSAVASPRNDSGDRDIQNPVSRIVRQVKTIVVHILDDILPGTPVPH
jgi:hypothetical protein